MSLESSAPATEATPVAGEAWARLLWRCRRGMRELDVMLGRYAREALPLTAPHEREAFEELLRLPDPVLAGCLLGGNTPPEPRLAHLARAIRTYVAKHPRSALF